MISDLFRHEHPDKRTNKEWLKALAIKIPYKSGEETANCKICGKEFKKRLGVQVTCSPKCSNINKYANVAKWKAENIAPSTKFTKNCVICNEQFNTHIPNKITCSYICSHTYKVNKTKQWRNEIRTRTNSLEGHNH